MWPMLLDLSRDESKRVLRRIELEAYSSIITAFRAQGDLTKEKKSMLQDLQTVLSISTERHRAEVRRAVNDEKLATVADNIAGSNTTSEWMIEGRRLVPLMPRLVPQTAFTATANQAAHLQAEKNLTLPMPIFTGNKDVNNVMSMSTSTSTPAVSRPSCPTSPTSNVVVLPSGASIHIKGCLNTEYEEELHTRKRRRSLSSDSLSSSIGTQTPRLTYPTTTSSSAVPNISPVKITISKSPQGRTIVSTPGVQPPKVILVTTSGQTPSHNVFQKSMSVPVVRASASMSQGTGTARAPIMVPSSSPVSSGASLSNIYTVTTTSLTSSITSPVTTSVLGSPPAMVINSGLPKPRPKIIPRQRLPQPIPSQKPGVVIPMTPQPVQPSPQSYQIKTINKPTIQIKQEGGMKIITQSLPAGTSKILPKPAHLSGTSGTPVVVVNAGPSGTATTSVSMVTKPVTTLSANHPGGKVLNISTGGRVIATTTKASNVVTVNPKTLHLTAVKTGAGTTVSKPNVIVVQKTQTRRSSTPTHVGSGSTQATVITHPSLFEKELANFIQKQELGKNVSVTVASSSSLGSTLSKIGDRKVIITTQTVGGEAAKQISTPLLQRSRSEQEGKTSSLLAELIQAAGIVPEPAAETDVPGTGSGNEWFEYDVADDQGQAVISKTEDSTAIDALLQMQAVDAAGKVKESSLASAQLERLQGQQSETQYYTIDQAMSLLNQTEKETVPTNSEPASDVIVKPVSEQPQIHIIKTSVPGSKLSSEHIQHIRVPLPSSRQLGLATRTLEVTRGQSVTGRELDPQTGLFSSGGVRKPRKNTIIVGLPPKVVQAAPVQSPKPVATTAAPNFDLLSSSLAQAQIELDPFDFSQDGATQSTESVTQSTESVTESTESITQSTDIVQQSLEGATQPTGDSGKSAEGATQSIEGGAQSTDRTAQPTDGAAVTETVKSAVVAESIESNTVSQSIECTTVAETTKDTSVVPETATVPQSDSQAGEVPKEDNSESKESGELSLSTEDVIMPPDVSEDAHTKSSSATTTPPAPARQGSSFIPLSDISSSTHKSAINVITHPQSSMPADIMETSKESDSSLSSENVVVTMEPTVDLITLRSEEFTTQQIEEKDTTLSSHLSEEKLFYDKTDVAVKEVPSVHSPPTGSSSDSQGESTLTDSGRDTNSLLRLSSRKRKQAMVDEPQHISTVGGWVKAALGLIQKMTKFRGVNRDKGDLNAAAWFIKPVDPVDAPNYYSVVKNPMDFGTIKKKLEAGDYKSFDDFHFDMLLVQKNCYLYNHPQSKVKQDCEEVFSFYEQERTKVIDKLQKGLTSSPITKKFRIDKSPAKS
ncbi:BRCA2-interacting transcriptional repressor EMSY-like isoform X2 [Gigantopelta aegis]|uniref:BRCA2-interacting transcriptional repressor EMSY-like isoform X2 n=1 Tax=Gigantopelta aegis TaxID=1735272 RepID=UPI001B88CC5F|nr:BRCA2-interacting transcriptional repressor EMSY-like isoform X2 [Gigantopelta aegis]